MNSHLKQFDKGSITVDGKAYDVFTRRKTSSGAEAPKLIVVSYLPNYLARGILEMCIETIQKYTPEEHELWVVDNNSPFKNIEWLVEKPGINIVFNRTDPGSGSYANAIGLEIAVRSISPDTRYFMTLHQDVMVCKTGWLSRMLSKMNERVRAVGVRLDKNRVPGGILHVLGYIVDFQVFKDLRLSFLPQLPNYDVGDLAIVNLRKAGYGIYSFPNSLHDPDLVQKLPQGSPYNKYSVDRTFDDDNEVFFLHLGRGLVKSEGKYEHPGKVMPEDWIDLGRSILGESPRDKKVHPQFDEITYSVRRYFVDEFLQRKIREFPDESTIIDLGGKKNNKRGQFDIEKYPLKVRYANIDKDADPDYLCDIVSIPVADNTFDGAVCSEVMEHLPEPKLALEEAYRILKPGGMILISAPFLFQIHADPADYGRYTETFWKESMSRIGFSDITVEKQGLFFSVIADMFRCWTQNIGNGKSKFTMWMAIRLTAWARRKAFEWEHRPQVRTSGFYGNFTTGYGISARK